MRETCLQRGAQQPRQQGRVVCAWTTWEVRHLRQHCLLLHRHHCGQRHPEQASIRAEFRFWRQGAHQGQQAQNGLHIGLELRVSPDLEALLQGGHETRQGLMALAARHNK